MLNISITLFLNNKVKKNILVQNTNQDKDKLKKILMSFKNWFNFLI